MSWNLKSSEGGTAEEAIRNDVVTRLAYGRPPAVYRVTPETFRQIALRLSTRIVERRHPLDLDGPSIACIELYPNGREVLVFTGAVDLVDGDIAWEELPVAGPTGAMAS